MSNPQPDNQTTTSNSSPITNSPYKKDESMFNNTIIHNKNGKSHIAKFIGYSQSPPQSQIVQYANYSLSITTHGNSDSGNDSNTDDDVNCRILGYIQDLSFILSINHQHLTDPCERLYVCYMDEIEDQACDKRVKAPTNGQSNYGSYNSSVMSDDSIKSGDTSNSANTLLDSESNSSQASVRSKRKHQNEGEQARPSNSKRLKSNSEQLLLTNAGKVMIKADRWMKNFIQKLCQDPQDCEQYLKYVWLIPTGYFSSKNNTFDARCVSFRIVYVNRTFDDDHDKCSSSSSSSNKDKRLEFISIEKIPSSIRNVIDMMNRNMESYIDEYPVLKELSDVYIAFNYIASNQAESSQNQSDYLFNYSNDTNGSSGQRSHDDISEENSSSSSITAQTKEEKLACGMNRLKISDDSDNTNNIADPMDDEIFLNGGISLVLDGDYQSNIYYPGKDFDYLERIIDESIEAGKSHFQVPRVNYKQYLNIREKHRISSSTSNGSSNGKNDKESSINDEEQVSKIVNILYPSDISADDLDKLIEEAMNRKSKIQNTRLLIEESVSNNPVPSKDKESTKDIKSETGKTDLETISEDINSVNITTPTRSIETEESKLFLKMVHGIKDKDDIYPKDWVADINNSVIQLCIAKVIHDMIIANQSIPRSNDARFIVFDHYPLLAGSYESRIQEHVHSISGSLVPSEDIPLPSTIFLFIQALSNMVGMDDICNLIAIIYLNRLQTRTSLVLSKANYRSLWLAAVDVAQKTWQEKPKRARDFKRYFSNTRISLLRNMERLFLNSINVEVRIAPEVYAKYYHGLKLAHDRIFGMKSGRQWNEKLDVQSTANIDPNTMDSKAISKNSNDTNTSKSRGSLSSGETDGSTSTSTATTATATSESSKNSGDISVKKTIAHDVYGKNPTFPVDLEIKAMKIPSSIRDIGTLIEDDEEDDDD